MRKFKLLTLLIIFCLLLMTSHIFAQVVNTYNYTGGVQTFVVPAGVTSITIEAWGAEGGRTGSYYGGKGGYATGTLSVTPGNTLYIYVGGQGAVYAGAQSSWTSGGMNGGGQGYRGGGGGGGASDVRRNGTSYADRVIVAGGGGGAASATNCFGGPGGGTTGVAGYRFNNWNPMYCGQGGTQSAGGAACTEYGLATAGSLGVGGRGGTSGNWDGTGGGGGYYGGGGGDQGGGGGGSSYTGGVTAGSTTPNVRNGHGMVRLTYSSTIPVLSTSSITGITGTAAISGGNITLQGGSAVTARGVCWSTSTGPTISNSKTTDGTGTGSFVSNITGLNPGTTYYVRAYATNTQGTGYGDELSFTTLSLPTVTTTAASSITSTGASSGGEVTAQGSSSVTARGVCWSTDASPTLNDSFTTDGSGTGTYASIITGLSPNRTYYLRAYATSSVGTTYGNEVSFRTSYGEITWDGSESIFWSEPGNWDLNLTPNADYNVTIPIAGNNPEISSGSSATCNNLYINPNASLTVASGGSLINNGTVNGVISIQRTITGSSNLESNAYHLVSVPLHPDNNSLSELFLGSYLYGYDPDENEWSPMGTSTSVELNETLGYMIFYPDVSTTYTFTGQPNTGTFAPTVTYAGNSGGNNFALVPNPYPSNIDWNAASGWTKTNIGNSIWVYNNGNYAIWDGSNSTNDGSRFIAVGQAFFVQTTAENPELVMDNDVRTHTSAAFLKNHVVPANQLRVKAMANNMQDEIIAGFADGKSAAYDPLEDALKLFGAEDAPQLYTLAGDSKVSINQLAELNGSAAVPMYFETEFNGEVNFEFSQLESFPADLKIRLEDKITGQWVNLRETSQYIFTHSPANTADRFVLHFGSAAGISEPVQDKVKMWAANNSLYLSTPELAGEKACIELFNTAGQIILEKNLTLNALQQFNLTAKGVVLVRITLSDRLLTAKTIAL